MDFEFDGVAQGPAWFLYADPRGSIVLNTRHDGTNAQIDTYDAYGVNGSANAGRFQYTGQAWLAELGMYYYKARIYSPRLGRFLQTDPIGYEDNVDLYVYVGNDPINGVDPTGLAICANEDCSMSYINPLPAGEQGPVIIFRNDDPNGESTFKPITTETAKMVEAAVIESGVNHVNINSTVRNGGGTSNHDRAKAVDINAIDGENFTESGLPVSGELRDKVEALLEAFADQPNIRENFGPVSNTKVSVPGQAPRPVRGSVPRQHRNHIHVSGQR